MECQSLFSGKNKKHSLSSAELAQRDVTVNMSEIMIAIQTAIWIMQVLKRSTVHSTAFGKTFFFSFFFMVFIFYFFYFLFIYLFIYLFIFFFCLAFYFWLTISYYKLFVFSVFCSQIFTPKINKRPKLVWPVQFLKWSDFL